MRLFLCSHFEKVGILLKEEVKGKNVLFIPTASINQEYKVYVETARTLWKKMNVNLLEVEISTASSDEIQTAFEKTDIIYFTGGNSFFLIDQLIKTGVDKLVKKHLSEGKLYVGESAGAVVCAKEISYIEPMDKIPENYSQKDYSGLGLIDFYVLPHYLCPPFEKSTQQILDESKDLNLYAINNSQAILVDGATKKELSVE